MYCKWIVIICVSVVCGIDASLIAIFTHPTRFPIHIEARIVDFDLYWWIALLFKIRIGFVSFEANRHLYFVKFAKFWYVCSVWRICFGGRICLHTYGGILVFTKILILVFRDERGFGHRFEYDFIREMATSLESIFFWRQERLKVRQRRNLCWRVSDAVTFLEIFFKWAIPNPLRFLVDSILVSIVFTNLETFWLESYW